MIGIFNAILKPRFSHTTSDHLSKQEQQRQQEIQNSLICINMPPCASR